MTTHDGNEVGSSLILPPTTSMDVTRLPRRSFLVSAAAVAAIGGIEKARGRDGGDTIILTFRETECTPEQAQRIAAEMETITQCRCIAVLLQDDSWLAVVNKKPTFRHAWDGGPKTRVVARDTGEDLPGCVWADAASGLVAQRHRVTGQLTRHCTVRYVPEGIEFRPMQG